MSSSQTATLSPPALDASAISSAVRSYAGLVYATARRIVGDSALAEDVAQSAFAVLAKKFHRINPQVLPGWLVNTTRLTARNVLRTRRTQLKHETRAASLKRAADPAPSEPTVNELLPLLDDALSRLNEIDRTAVVLRFFQGQSFAQVATHIGSTEDTARKRVTRAVDKLRAIFMQQGQLPSVGGVALMLASQQSSHPPVSVIEAVHRAIESATKTKSSFPAQAAAKIFSAKAAAIALVASLAVVVVAHRLSAGDTGPQQVAQASLSLPATAPTDAPARPVNAVAQFSDGTTVELFAVNTNPDAGQPGWRADGGPLNATTFTDVPNHFQNGDAPGFFEFGLRFTGTDHQRNPWNALNIRWSAGGAPLGLAPRTKNRKVIPNEWVLLGHFAPEADQADITIRLAPFSDFVVAGIKTDVPGAKVVGEYKPIGHFELSNLREVDGNATVTALTPPIPDDWQLVIRAVPRHRGFISPTPQSPAVGGTNGETKDIAFQAKLADISEIRAELRDYSTSVVFHNIVLKPGVHGGFHFVTSESVHVPPNTPTPATPGAEQGL